MSTIKQAYVEGFVGHCRARGVDPGALVKAAMGTPPANAGAVKADVQARKGWWSRFRDSIMKDARTLQGWDRIPQAQADLERMAAGTYTPLRQ